MSRRTGIALVLAALAAASVAQARAQVQDAGVMAETWGFFLDRCGLAYRDPQAYLDGIAAGAGGLSGTFGASEDGQVVWAGTSGMRRSDTFQIAVVGNSRYRSCHAMNVFDDQPVSGAALDAAFRGILAGSPGVEVAGGLMPDRGLSPPATGEIAAYSYRYVVRGALPESILASVDVSPWVIEIFSYSSDGGG